MSPLFGALVVLLMLFFNYIEISSGMNRKDKQPKTLKLFSEKPELLGRKAEENSALSMRMNDRRKLQLLNERTERLVDDDSLKKLKPSFDVRRQNPPHLDTIPKMPWGVQRNPSVQKNHANFDNHHAHANRRECEYADTASSQPRSEALTSYHSYKEQHGLTPVLPRTSGHKANVLNQKEYLLYVDTPRPEQPPAAGHAPYILNQGQDGQYYETPRPGQFGQYYEQFPHHPYYGRPYGPSESSNRH